MSVVPETYDELLHLALVLYDAGQADAHGRPALTIASPSLAALVNETRRAWECRMRLLPDEEPPAPAWLRNLQEDTHE